MPQVLSREDELHRTSRALRTLSGSNRALLRVEDRKVLLQEICRVIVEEAGYRAATVVRLDPDDGCTFTPLAQFGHHDAFVELRQTMASQGEEARPSSEVSWRDQSVTNLAIRSGEPCLVNDVQNSPKIAVQWRDFHRRHGFGSVFALPLHVGGQVFGALTILAPEPDAFDEFEREPLLEAAADLSFGLETLDARERHAEAQRALHRLMMYDPVSGLPNRAHLHQLLTSELAKSKAGRRPVTLIRLAIDRFQEFDEILGGEVARQLVEQVARRLEEALQPGEVLTQMAEAEFAVVASAAGAEKGRQIASRLVNVAAEPFEVEGMQLHALLAAGLAVFPGHGEDAAVLSRRAGLALANARRSTAPVAVFTPNLDMECGGNIAIMADLRKAIPNGELRLFCQPKIEIERLRPYGLEALVRWAHPARGLLNPGEFIHVAESTGLITSITYWVLEDALRQLYAWRESGIEQPVSVNMSAHDLRDGHFLETVSDKLATWGARPGMIEFELTESALMENPAQAVEVLRNLKELDVRLSIDDFGTGYSSLSYLRQLPVDTIKIDQSFVRGLVTDPGCAAIVRSTIDLGHTLKLHVTAEGVEDDATFDALKRLGCDFAQGYGISKPIPAAEFERWLRARGMP